MNSDEEDAADFPPAWEMLEFTFSLTYSDVEMVTVCNGRRVIINIEADSFAASPALHEKYLFFLQVAEHFELDGVTVEDFEDWIAEPLFPVFRQLETLPPVDDSLEAFFFPEAQSYDLYCEGDIIRYAPSGNEREPPRLYGIATAGIDLSLWTRFKPSQVTICRDHRPADPTRPPKSPRPTKVKLEDGSIAFLKLMRTGDTGFFKQGLETYRRIHLAALDDSLRISRLLGLVVDSSEKVMGLLLTYLDCGNVTLFCAARPGSDPAMRKKWAKQVEETVGELHKAGIAWGDAKPENVLIGRSGDAWLVDFGGAYTPGWVSKERADTMEGDLEALGTMKRMLEGDGITDPEEDGK